MTQESLPLESRSLLGFVGIKRRRFGLMWKVVGTISGIVVLFGLLVLAVVHHVMARALRVQLDQRALAIAANLSDAAAGHVVGRNSLELYALVTKYALLEDVAYAFIQDSKGQIVSHSLGIFPAELRESLSPGDRRQVHRREISLRGKTVHETRVPVLGGQVGAVHVGIWGEVVEKEIRNALVPLIEFIMALLLLATGFSLLLAGGIIRPILRLKQIAENMSKGDLDTLIGIERHDEIGDLGHSLERLRASLKAAMARLSRDRMQATIEKIERTLRK